jgi:hypothetical protein
LAIEDIAHEWYTSLRPLSITSWQQIKAKLLATFQGYQSGTKTTTNLMNCIQQDNEPLSEYLERFIQLKAQVPNVPEATVIAAAIDGLAIGQCASFLSREPPTTVKELFEVMRRYARSDENYKRQKAKQTNMRQTGRIPRPPLQPNQQNVKPFRAVNNLQEDSGQSAPEQEFRAQAQIQPYRPFDHSSQGARGGRGIHGGCDGRGRGRGQRPPYCAICGENAGHFTRDCKYSKMAKEQKEKDDASRSSETPKHVFHNASSAGSSHNQPHNQPFFPVESSFAYQTNLSQGLVQAPFAWHLPAYSPYQ